MATYKKTMTAEEVEQSRKHLSKYLHKLLGDYDRGEQDALSRLAAQAARVEGLEASLKASLANTEEALAERDAARKEADSALTCCGGNDAPKGKREHTQDCNRREAEGLRLGQDNATLRERVATLEGTEERTRERLSQLIDEARQERDTAVARVKELEGHLAAVNEAVGDLGGTVTSEVEALQGKVRELEGTLRDVDAALEDHGEPTWFPVGLWSRLKSALASPTPPTDLALLEDALYHEDAKGLGAPL